MAARVVLPCCGAANSASPNPLAGLWGHFNEGEREEKGKKEMENGRKERDKFLVVALTMSSNRRRQHSVYSTVTRTKVVFMHFHTLRRKLL